MRIIREDDDSMELWMLPYSTFMIILVILFLVFYSFSYRNSIEYEAALTDLASLKHDPQAQTARKEVAFAKNLKKMIAEAGISSSAVLAISAQHIKLQLNTPVMFDSGSAELKTDIVPFLEKLRRELGGIDNLVIVEGHTDNVPIHSGRFNSNWELSTARAFGVMHFFINKGIPPSRLVAHGFGEFRPVSSNDTEDGKAKNRRIEITIPRGLK